MTSMNEEGKPQASRSALIKRILLFSIGPLLGIVAPLVTLPAISTQFGQPGWASVAVGQSVGAAGAIVVELGWGLSGPPAIARAGSTTRAQLFWQSMRQRLIALLVLLPVVVAVVVFSGLDYPVAAILTAFAMLLTGFSGSWFYIGAGRPMALILFDSAPRMLASLCGAILLLMGADLISLPIVQAAVAVGIAFTPLLIMRGSTVPEPAGNASVKTGWRQQFLPLVARMATSAYVALPTTFFAMLGASTASVANYAGGDRLARTGLSALSPFSQALQGWVPSASNPRELSRRMRTALVLNGAVAVVGALAFLLLFDPLAGLIFGGTVSIDFWTKIAFMVVIASVVMSRCLGVQCLPSLGHFRPVAISTIVGLVVSIPLMVIFGKLWDVPGIGWALAVTEFCVTGIQAVALIRLWPRQGAGQSYSVKTAERGV